MYVCTYVCSTRNNSVCGRAALRSTCTRIESMPSHSQPCIGPYCANALSLHWLGLWKKNSSLEMFNDPSLGVIPIQNIAAYGSPVSALSFALHGLVHPENDQGDVGRITTVRDWTLTHWWNVWDEPTAEVVQSCRVVVLGFWPSAMKTGKGTAIQGTYVLRIRNVYAINNWQLI